MKTLRAITAAVLGIATLPLGCTTGSGTQSQMTTEPRPTTTARASDAVIHVAGLSCPF